MVVKSKLVVYVLLTVRFFGGDRPTTFATCRGRGSKVER